MLSLLLLLSAPADASDVGSPNKFGIGVASGPSAIDFTGKYYFNEKAGLAFYAGTSFVYHNVRVNYESEIKTFVEWPWAEFVMYWDAGVDAELWTFYGSTFEVGVGGGVGVELQFEKVPAQVFVDAGLGVYPVNYCSGITASTGVPCFGWVQGRGAAGARWYF